MLLAVLEARAELVLANREVYLNVAGGYKISDPSADLAAAASLISATLDIALPADTVFFGEIGLSGDIRPVPQRNMRLKEAAKLGFARAVIPAQGKQESCGLAIVETGHITEMISWIQNI